MDDLLSEDWQKPAKPKPPSQPLPTSLASNYSSLRASPQLPQSGTSSPATLSRPSSTVNGSRPPTNDSFGNLVSLKPQKAVAAQSMQERQKQLLDEKRRQEQQQAQLWETLGSGTATPEIRQPSPAAAQDDDDDILAAFRKDAPVNRASHFNPPPPSGQVSGRSTPAVVPPAPATITTSASAGFDEDDDPFGLNEVARKSNGHVAAPAPKPLDDDDDILGDLGKPVSEKPPQASRGSLEEPMIDRGEEDSTPAGVHDNATPADRALAELVDMGFPADTAKIALSENGGDVQGAVGWLLQQAHEASRQKAREETSTSRSPQRRAAPSTDREGMPAWLRQEDPSASSSRRQDARSPANGELDPAQAAQQLGTKFFKSANALWKASQKQMAKTIAEFQQEGDPSQPRWMREPALDSAQPEPQRRQPPPSKPSARPIDVTDEAAMLDAPRQKPAKPSRPAAPPQTADAQPNLRSPVEPLPHRQAPQPKFMQQAPSLPDKKPTTKLSRQDVEDQTAQAYVSPARRKRPPPPKPEPQPEPEVDLFSPAPAQAPPTQSPPPLNTRSAPPQQPRIQPATRPTAPTAPPKPKAPPRTIPPISPTALATSANHRKQGGEHFKRGDYAAAHDSYTAALTPLPPTHPIAIIVLTNRALTALKTGDAKVAVADADRALEIIGPGLGADETIDLGPGEGGAKGMREFYGKAVMRKAEALEHLEKYGEAAGMWRLAVAAGVGGAVSLKGRDRCEKAAGGGGATAPNGGAGVGGATAAAPPKIARNTTPASAPGKAAPPARSLGTTLTRPTIPSASSASAVKKLRAANAEAEKIDDEKFALADAVDAKLTAWRSGKTDNLRALLQSMDAVLWEGAGWKKVGMSDLVVPGKVKVVYMKAIAKVHPDKIPQDATTEQRMISAAVFATLNEAWDKFKKDNNL